MKQHQCKLVFSDKSCRIEAKDQRNHKQIKALIVMLIAILSSSLPVEASVTCKGNFVNPITDVCWECLLPISIGGLSIGKGGKPKRRDTKNPVSPVCACSKFGQPVPIPGISIGFWEPVRLIDVTRTPY